MTKEGDLGFSIKKINGDGSKSNVVEKERFNCNISPEEGQILLDEHGTCKYLLGMVCLQSNQSFMSFYKKS